MITLSEAIKAYKSKAPVIFSHPMQIKPIECRIAEVLFRKSTNKLVRLVLEQQPGSYIKTLPEYVFIPEEHHAERPETGKFGKEVSEALEVLGQLKEIGFICE